MSVIHLVTDKKINSKYEIISEAINGVNTYIAYIKFTKNPLVKSYRFFSAFLEVYNSINKVNIVHLNILSPLGIFALYLNKIKKIPFIISEHWTGYHTINRNNISIFKKYIYRLIASRALYICPVSHDLKNSMQEFGLKGQYKIVPNVVDTDLFNPGKKKADKKFKIIHISNHLDKHKNIRGMLNVAKKLEPEIPNFEWKFIGGKKNEYKKEITELNSSKIKFIAHIPHSELVTHLQESDIFVLFSNYENLPCVILESFSCGVGVISTEVGGINEFFPNDFGHLIPKKDEKKLLNKLLDVYKKPIKETENMHQYAVKNFSKLSIAKQFHKIYSTCLNRE